MHNGLTEIDGPIIHENDQPVDIKVSVDESIDSIAQTIKEYMEKNSDEIR